MDKEQSEQEPLEEPLVEVEYQGTRITVLGTAHVSQASSNKVSALLKGDDYDSVAVELCQSRYDTLLSPDRFLNMDLAQVIRQHKVFRVVAILILGGYQQRVAESLGVEPGLEFKEALRIAKQRNLSLAIVDRDIGVTFKRLYASLSWWRKLVLFNTLVASLFYTEEVSVEEVERIKQGRTLEAMFEQIPMSLRNLKKILLDERDTYMATKVKQFIDHDKPNSLLAIVGAAHLPGVVRQLKQPNDNAEAIISDLETVPPRKRIIRLLPWLVVFVILAGFGYGFTKEVQLGFELVIDWILINGGLAAVGALIAAAHPLTIIAVFFAAPLTSINPTVGAGMVAALVELFLKKPRVSDFANLKKDTAKWSGWRQNRVAKIAMIFVLSSIGSAIGTYIGGFHIYSTLISQ
ncbi:MAG: TraB/GumN family protein [Chromatiales bacterium]|nr:TraB/GumN family protein [Chromatiales bacterium]